MKPLKRTCLVLALMLALSPMLTRASPEITSFRCALTFDMDEGDAIEEPVGRWIAEIVDLTRPTLRYAQWPGGEQLRVDVAMGALDAFDWTFIIEDGRACMTTSLAPGQIFLCDAGQYTCVRDVVDVIVCAVYPYGDTDEWESDGDGMARALSMMAKKMRGWRDDGTAEAFAGLFDTLAEKYGGSSAATRISAHYADNAGWPDDGWPDAGWPPDADKGVPPDMETLLSEMFLSVMRALADQAA